MNKVEVLRQKWKVFLNNHVNTNSYLTYNFFFSDNGLVVEEPNMSETNTSAQKDEFSEILGSHFNLDSMVRETGEYIFNIFFFRFPSVFSHSIIYS